MPCSDTWVALSKVEPEIGTILRTEWWFIKKKRFDIGRCLLHRHSSFCPLLGEGDYLTSPKNVCEGGYSRSSNRSFFINHNSDLKMVTSPVKLWSRLKVSTKGASWSFKSRWTSIYSSLTCSDWSECAPLWNDFFAHLRCRLLPFLACPCDFHEESAHIFYLVA